LSVSRVGTLLFPAIAATKDQAPCLAEVGQALSGKARYLYEIAAGNSAVASEDPVVPANPQGLTGVDLSGPPWGSAILRPVALFGGTASNANLQAPNRKLLATADGSVYDFALWVRPHSPMSDGYLPPEGTFGLLLRAYAASGTPTLTVTATDDYGSQAEALALSTTETNFAPSIYWRARPQGGLQYLRLILTCASTAYVTAAALCVATKRGT